MCYFLEYETPVAKTRPRIVDAGVPKRIYFDTNALPERDRFPMSCEKAGRRCIGLDFRTIIRNRRAIARVL
jgi:hypothetical protein